MVPACTLDHQKGALPSVADTTWTLASSQLNDTFLLSGRQITDSAAAVSAAVSSLDAEVSHGVLRY